jgi:hypothetical protein
MINKLNKTQKVFILGLFTGIWLLPYAKGDDIFALFLISFCLLGAYLFQDKK